MHMIGRGISTALIAFVIAVVVLTLFTYMFLNTYFSLLSSSMTFGSVARYYHSYEVSKLVLNTTGNKVYMKNVGSSDIVIDKLVVKDSTGSVKVFQSADVQTLCSSRVIPAQRSVECSSGYDYLAVITPDGVVINPQQPVVKGYLVKTNTTYIMPITFSGISSPLDFVQLFNVSKELVAKPYTNTVVRGMTSGGQLLLLPLGQESEFYKTSVQTDNNGITFGVAVIGYDPSWVREKQLNPNTATPPRFSIMIAGPKAQGEKITYGNRQVTLSENGYRILIRNFTGVVKILDSSGNTVACTSSLPSGCGNAVRSAMGFWYYGTTDLGYRLYLSGVADYVANFMRIASSNSPTRETSYYPYIYVGDVDGNNMIDIVFVTEDAYYGSTSRVDDCVGDDCSPPRGNDIDLSDWSTEPLKLVFPQVGKALGSSDGSIDGGVYAGVALYMNIFFHDDSYPDENQLQDNDRTDWVLRVLLIDDKGNEYVVREYRYQEICNYHKTRITDFDKDNYFVKLSQSIYVPLPSTGRYWIAIAFQDPYRGGSTTNDVDITVGVEFIGVVPFFR